MGKKLAIPEENIWEYPPPPPDTHQTQVQNVTLEPVRDNPKAVPGSFSAKTLFYNQITHTLKNALQTQSIKFPQ